MGIDKSDIYDYLDFLYKAESYGNRLSLFNIFLQKYAVYYKTYKCLASLALASI